MVTPPKLLRRCPAQLQESLTLGQVLRDGKVLVRLVELIRPQTVRRDRVFKRPATGMSILLVDRFSGLAPETRWSATVVISPPPCFLFPCMDYRADAQKRANIKEFLRCARRLRIPSERLFAVDDLLRTSDPCGLFACLFVCVFACVFQHAIRDGNAVSHALLSPPPFPSFFHHVSIAIGRWREHGCGGRGVAGPGAGGGAARIRAGHPPHPSRGPQGELPMRRRCGGCGVVG